MNIAKVTLRNVIVISLVVLSTAPAHSQVKKYGIKSGIVTFEQDMKMGGKFFQKSKHIVYFDDYGMKECKETFENEVLTESFFSNGKDLVKVIHEQKTAYFSGPASAGTELKVDWSEVSEKDKKAGIAKKLGSKTVAGRICDAYEYKQSSSAMVYAGWNGICLFSDVTGGGMQTIAQAVKLEENAKVPPEKFEVPKGYTTKSAF
ncbi:MAG: hypothetical protein HYY49_11230 [Ignavibacteriales bacterium]|nr:hypothetical protein [Ignavibacteriales bacterium]